MECPRCHNRNQKFIYQVHGEYYCRKCIAFSKVKIDIPRKTRELKFMNPKDYTYSLKFNLTSSQRTISHKLLTSYKNRENAYVWAVCGSGKTEIVYEVMSYALAQGKRVCFCVPRKELVKELYQRIKTAFHCPIGIAYGGVAKNLDAQLIVCTMHQLYRFENHVGFDLMIADEVDAFPFYDNDVLNEIFQRCCLGCFIKMSATIEEKDIKDGQVFILNRRYHGNDLPIPLFLVCANRLQKYLLLYLIKKLKEKIIIYVPTKQMVISLVSFLKKWGIQAAGVSSQLPNNSQQIYLFSNDALSVLVSTTLLERGITIENVQVIVYQANHYVFNWKTLIQIAGRVGRKPNAPTGHVYILSSGQTNDIKKCIRTLKKLNQMSA